MYSAIRIALWRFYKSRLFPATPNSQPSEPSADTPGPAARHARLQLDEVGRERQVQQQGRQRAEALAERSVEIAQAMVPLAGAWRVRSRVGVAEGVWREG